MLQFIRIGSTASFPRQSELDHSRADSVFLWTFTWKLVSCSPARFLQYRCINPILFQRWARVRDAAVSSSPLWSLRRGLRRGLLHGSLISAVVSAAVAAAVSLVVSSSPPLPAFSAVSSRWIKRWSSVVDGGPREKPALIQLIVSAGNLQSIHYYQAVNIG